MSSAFIVVLVLLASCTPTPATAQSTAVPTSMPSEIVYSSTEVISASLTLSWAFTATEVHFKMVGAETGDFMAFGFGTGMVGSRVFIAHSQFVCSLA